MHAVPEQAFFWQHNPIMLRPWLMAPFVLVAVVAMYLAFGRGGGVSVDGPVVAHDRGWGLGSTSGMDALVGGVLEFQGRCLLLSGDVVVWPDGTQWDAERAAVRLGADGALLRVGDSVSGGGGMTAEEPDSVEVWKRSESGHALADCLAPGAAVVVFNADADLKVESTH